MQRVGDAFELLRRHEVEEEPASPTPERESRRTSVGVLATLLAEADEALAKGDPKGIEATLEIVREALDMARRLEDLTHASGVRRRDPSKPAK